VSHADSFGFTPIPAASRQEAVNGVFERVAASYDRMNDAMSFGVHRLWKNAFVATIPARPGMAAVDVAGGTGDIARLLLARLPGVRLTLADINPAMLVQGRRRLWDEGHANIAVVCGNAESLPLSDSSQDIYTIAFGLRNVTHIDRALSEAFRVLKPGGMFRCLEFTPDVNPLIKPLYDAWSFGVIPRLGKLLAKDEAAYRYLIESIRRFPRRRALETMLRAAGFVCVGSQLYSGGIVAMHRAVKP
jgi:demethylmenaquinone methyltransferase/2-methoxy-6-polyprenyl-1,4-benzoquinol methylase